MTNDKQNKIKIAIADDHAVVRKGLIQIIEDTPDMLRYFRELN